MMRTLIALEQEIFLLKDGAIVEPALYEFPYDEFGFLVELRTQPHDNLQSLMTNYNILYSQLNERANKLGFTLLLKYRLPIEEDFVKRLERQYKYHLLEDLTANIYPNVRKSHATGLDGKFATAGLHIHFSRHDGNVRVQLPLFEIVKAFDERFHEIIKLTSRTHGEFEIKPHGFEYRSLPADIRVSIPAKFAFDLLGLSSMDDDLCDQK